MAPTEGRGIPEQAHGSQEPYNSITWMIHMALADAIGLDLEKYMLAKADTKLAHPKAYAGGFNLKEFERSSSQPF